MNTNEKIVTDTMIVQWWGVCFVYYLEPYSVLNPSLAQCTLVPYMSNSGMQLPSHHGIICFK